jgi:hypothetical protein
MQVTIQYRIQPKSVTMQSEMMDAGMLMTALVASNADAQQCLLPRIPRGFSLR